MFDFRKLVVKYLREVADKIEVGTSEVSESEAIDILRIVAHEAMSKEQACNYLNLSRARFDDLVREKRIPRGRKRVGFKELVFYKDELDAAVKRMKNGDVKEIIIFSALNFFMQLKNMDGIILFMLLLKITCL